MGSVHRSPHHATKNDDLTEIQFRRARKHAKATAEINDKRRAKGALRREDVNRAAYYVLLMVAFAPETPEPDRNRLRILLISILGRADFDKAQCRALFQEHNEDIAKDLNAWLNPALVRGEPPVGSGSWALRSLR